MEKISGIIPSSPRITTVDLQNSGASRPGMPSFGRREGVSTLAQNSNLRYSSSLGPDLGLEPTMGRRQQLSPIEQKAQIVKDVSNGFFMKKAQRYEQDLMGPKPGMEPGLPSDRFSVSLGSETPSQVSSRDYSSKGNTLTALERIQGGSEKTTKTTLQIPMDEPLVEITEGPEDLDMLEVGHYLDVSV